MAVTQVLTLTLVSQDTKTNTSQVRVLYKSTQTGGSYNLTDPVWRYTVTVNGVVTETVEGTADLHKNTTDILADRVITVTHDDHGKATVKVDAWMDTEISAGEVELTQTLALPDISRASAVSASDGLIGSRATVVITAGNGSYSHSLSYQFGELSGWVGPDGTSADAETVFSERTVNLLLPEKFYLQIPNAPTGTCTLTCTTYDNAVVIGTSKCTFTVTADPVRCAPAIVGAVTDGRAETLALTGDAGILIREQSTAHCTAAVTLAPGAGVKEIRVNGIVLKESLDIPNVSTGVFGFRVTDSRGYTGTCRVELPVVAYEQLNPVIAVSRVDPVTGIADLNIYGNWYDGSFGAVDNALTVTYQVNGGDVIAGDPSFGEQQYIESAKLTGLDYKASHTVDVVVRDALQTIQRTITIEPSIPVFDWGRNDFRFHVPVSMPSLTLDGIQISDTVIEWGCNGGQYWRKWSSGFAECWGRDYFRITAINIPCGGWYRADGEGSIYYPVDFVYPPAETVSVDANGRPHIVMRVSSNYYTILCPEPEEGEDILNFYYYAAGIWKDPTEGEL